MQQVAQTTGSNSNISHTKHYVEKYTVNVKTGWVFVCVHCVCMWGAGGGVTIRRTLGWRPRWSLWPFNTHPLPSAVRPRQAWWCPVWLPQACRANWAVMSQVCVTPTASPPPKKNPSLTPSASLQQSGSDWTTTRDTLSHGWTNLRRREGGWGVWHHCAECLRCQPCAF